MKQVTNKLKLHDGADESTILNAITEIENKSATEITALKNVVKTETEKATKSANALHELQGKYDAMEVENKARVDAMNKEKGTALAKKARLDGKIADTDEAENEWAELATLNYEGTEKLVNTLTVNKVGKKIETVATNLSNLPVGANMAATMARIAAEKNKK